MYRLEDYKSKLVQVFNYAKALNEVKNPIISDIENQRWSLWFKDLPNHNSVDYIDVNNQNSSEENRKDYLLRVKRPLITECPAPPEELRTYINGNWRDVDKKVELITEVELENGEHTETVEISDEIKSLFMSWNEERNRWLLIEKPARAAMNVFQQLYKLYSEIEKESETIELVVGDGILKWVLQNGKNINHPVLIQSVELQFDSQIPEFKIVTGNKESELYSAPWRNIDDVNSTAMSQCIEAMDKNHPSIIDGTSTDEFLISLSTALSSKGRFSKNTLDKSTNYEPVIIRDQVLFLRKRNLGFSVALEFILEDIITNDNIPPFLKKLVGYNEDLSSDTNDDSEQFSTNINGEDEDILFTKPSNSEQLLVVKQLEHSDAVLVQGPPGTGKTHTIANLVGHLLSQGKSVLITSYSEKALKVLRDKIVDPLKPLCLPVLKDNRKTDELEKTLDAMNEKRSSINKVFLEQQISSLDIERRNIIKSLKEKRENLKKEIKNEYRKIIFDGEDYSPKDAAMFIVANREGNDWIPGPVELGSSITLNNSEINDLYKSNSSINEEEEKECQFEYPEISSLMKPEEFEELVQEYNNLILNNLQYRIDLWNNPKEDINNYTKILEDILKTVSIVDENNTWSMEILQDGFQQELMKEEWKKLLQAVNDLHRESNKFKPMELEYSPIIEEDIDSDEIKIVLQEMHDFVKDNRKINKMKLLVKPKWSKVLSKVKINNREPSKVEEFKALIGYVEINQMRKKVIQRWNRQVTTIGGPDTSAFGKVPELQFKQYADFIEDRLNWYECKWKPLLDRLTCLGFNWDSFINEDKEIYPNYSDLLNIKRKVTMNLTEIFQA